jgi:AraC-like DNA-binding protein/mannose-6-phosphate isomerase-like protein (cupin superfamily)
MNKIAFDNANLAGKNYTLGIKKSIKFAQSSNFLPMDALSKILEAIKLKGVVYDKRELSAPWGLDISQDEASQFWRLLKGKCFLKVPGEPLLEMQEGDLVFVPHGSSHWIADHPGSRRVPSIEFRRARDSGKPMFTGDGDTSIFIGGHFEFDTKPAHPFLADLPNIIHITHFKTEVRAWLQHTANLIAEEVSRERPGSKIILGRLAEIAFVYLIRAYLEKADHAKGFLLALKDERISKALKLMQESPEKEWTLDLLSSAAGMSRSLFCHQFKIMVGETPLSYLTNWRIIKAKELLLTSKGNISELSMDVGYQSEAAFNRIFKKKVGQTPASFRRAKLSL